MLNVQCNSWNTLWGQQPIHDKIQNKAEIFYIFVFLYKTYTDFTDLDFDQKKKEDNRFHFQQIASVGERLQRARSSICLCFSPDRTKEKERERAKSGSSEWCHHSNECEIQLKIDKFLNVEKSLISLQISATKAPCYKSSFILRKWLSVGNRRHACTILYMNVVVFFFIFRK